MGVSYGTKNKTNGSGVKSQITRACIKNSVHLDQQKVVKDLYVKQQISDTFKNCIVIWHH